MNGTRLDCENTAGLACNVNMNPDFLRDIFGSSPPAPLFDGSSTGSAVIVLEEVVVEEKKCVAATPVSSGTGTPIYIGYTATPVPGTRHAVVVAGNPESGAVATRGGQGSVAAAATRAGPGSGPSGAKNVKGWQVAAEAGPFNERFTDAPSEIINDFQYVGDVNLSLDQVAQRMQNFADVTNANRVPYLGLTANSNSYSFTFIESLGFDRPYPMSGVIAPGWSVGSVSPLLECPP